MPTGTHDISTLLATRFQSVAAFGMDTIQQVQSHLLAHQYEALIEKSQLRGKKKSGAPKAPARR